MIWSVLEGADLMWSGKLHDHVSKGKLSQASAADHTDYASIKYILIYT